MAYSAFIRRTSSELFLRGRSQCFLVTSIAVCFLSRRLLSLLLCIGDFINVPLKMLAMGIYKGPVFNGAAKTREAHASCWSLELGNFAYRGEVDLQVSGT